MSEIQSIAIILY